MRPTWKSGHAGSTHLTRRAESIAIRCVSPSRHAGESVTSWGAAGSLVGNHGSAASLAAGNGSKHPAYSHAD